MDFDKNGNIIARYVQNPNVLDEPISIETAQGKFYYLFDGLDSVTGLTDNGGNLVVTYNLTSPVEVLYRSHCISLLVTKK